MDKKFHVGKGRYSGLVTHRYPDLTRRLEVVPGQEQREAPAEEAHGTYGALLFDKRWREKRTEILTRDNNQCVICKNGDDLQVHHRQYQFIKALNQFKAPWDYENHLLITLCENCHARGHSKFKVPNIYV